MQLLLFDCAVASVVCARKMQISRYLSPGRTNSFLSSRLPPIPSFLSVSCVVGRVMRIQGWVSLTNLAAGFLCSASRRLAASLNTQKHVCLFSQSAAANMAEEAKKLAAYAAVDNHVQVR